MCCAAGCDTVCQWQCGRDSAQQLQLFCALVVRLTERKPALASLPAAAGVHSSYILQSSSTVACLAATAAAAAGGVRSSALLSQ